MLQYTVYIEWNLSSWMPTQKDWKRSVYLWWACNTLSTIHPRVLLYTLQKVQVHLCGSVLWPLSYPVPIKYCIVKESVPIKYCIVKDSVSMKYCMVKDSVPLSVPFLAPPIQGRWGIGSKQNCSTELYSILQTQTLPNATPPKGKTSPFTILLFLLKHWSD